MARRRIQPNDAGNVGIGTGTPSALLHILGATPTIIASAGGNVAGDGGQVDFRVNVNPTWGSMSAVKGVLENMGLEQQGGIAFLTRPVSAGSVSLTERVRITSAGNVGIGTSSPSTKLTVRDASNSTVRVTSDGYVAASLERYSTDAFSGDLVFFKARGTNSSPTTIATGDSLITVRGYAYDGSNWRESVTILGATEGTVASGNVSGTFSVFTAKSGSNTEKFRINSDGLITGTGTSLGAWTAWTPTLTGFTLGNGSLTARYCIVGKIMYWQFAFTAGSTSTFTGAMSFTLPFTVLQGDNNIGVGYVYDASTALGQNTIVYTSGGTNVTPRRYDTIGGYSSTVPFTWATSDQMRLQGVVEIA